MSAPYPLVRNFNDFSTRAGVRASPSRPASSPSSTRSCRMRSCIFVFYIALFLVPVAGGAADTRSAQAANGDPDLLYRERSDPAKTRAAAAIWASRLAANPRD